MSDPFIGELRIMSFGYAPRGWAMCNGQIMQISQNQALFSLLGTMYGGNGVQTFALPNLQGRVPIHTGPANVQGVSAGQESHTLSFSELPAHGHPIRAKAAASPAGPVGRAPNANKVLAEANAAVTGGTSPVNIYGTGAPTSVMAPAMIGLAGGSQAHENRQPFLALNICIALQGIFPSRN